MILAKAWIIVFITMLVYPLLAEDPLRPVHWPDCMALFGCRRMTKTEDGKKYFFLILQYGRN